MVSLRLVRCYLSTALCCFVSILASESIAATQVRMGHFNIREMNHKKLDVTHNLNIQWSAGIIQKFAPDILSINEISYDIAGQGGSTHTGINIEQFQDNYLSIGQLGESPINYPYTYWAQGNSGLDSGLGFDYGFGRFEGEFNMALYSKYPILTGQVRRFQMFLWKDLPGNIKPAFVSDQQRLFDKDFWDVPIDVNGEVVHVLMCHAVVPIFEPENDERNFDTMRFIADYIAGNATYAVADGGIQPGDRFVLMGDLNADPADGDSMPGAIQQITNLARVYETYPEGDGLDTDGVPPDNTSYNTSSTDFVRKTFKSGVGDISAGGFQLQLDYILPGITLPLITPPAGQKASGVYWDEIGTTEWYNQRNSSDHHFMWTDVAVCNDPFADVDGDGDVDSDDFGEWQRCMTTGGAAYDPRCGCFDRNSDGEVTFSGDFTAFEDCVSGPGVPADATCDDMP